MSRTIVALLALAFLAGCGKKPRDVGPPVGSEEVVYPRVYPPDPDNPNPQRAPTLPSILRSKI
jgi:hypothetical protein